MIYPSTPFYLTKACEQLASGNLVVIPTETVYGLAGDALNDRSIAKIYEIKRRPSFNPLIIHVATLQQAQEYGEFNDDAIRLANAFWPGPLTLVVNRIDYGSVSLLATAGLDTMAIRIPSHPVALELLATYNKPLAAPSANLSESISPTCSEDAVIALSRDQESILASSIPMIIDGGRSMVGLESTVIDVSGDIPLLLRPGGIAVEEIEAILGKTIERDLTSNKSPGTMKRHYAPNIPLRMNAIDKRDGEAFLSFGKNFKSIETLNLSEDEDLSEAASNLFRMLRQLDQSMFNGIAVAEVPNYGLGFAINDRIERASVPKSKNL
jgi:L-threonylcarbamoyladenylate synthase